MVHPHSNSAIVLDSAEVPMPSASSLPQGEPVTRQVLVVIGAALLCVSGLGFVIGLVWLWSSFVHGTPEYVIEARFQTMLAMLPALLLAAAFLGATLMAHSLAARHGAAKKSQALEMHSRSHA